MSSDFDMQGGGGIAGYSYQIPEVFPLLILCMLPLYVYVGQGITNFGSLQGQFV